MAVRKVLRMGDPRLLKVAEPVTEFNTPELDALIQDMLDTMAALDGAGLAAPQIGVGKRLVIFGVEANPRYPEVEPVPTTILINPQLQAVAKDMDEEWRAASACPACADWCRVIRACVTAATTGAASNSPVRWMVSTPG